MIAFSRPVDSRAVRLPSIISEWPLSNLSEQDDPARLEDDLYQRSEQSCDDMTGSRPDDADQPACDHVERIVYSCIHPGEGIQG